MSNNALIKYINNKNIGCEIDTSVDAGNKLPDPTTVGIGSNVEITDSNGNKFITQVTSTGYVNTNNPRPTKLVSWMPNILGYVDSSNTFTYSLTKSAPCEFESVAIILQNQSTNPVTVTASVAVSESLATSKTIPKINGVDYNVVASAGTQNGFVPVTYNNGVSPIVIPASTELFLTDQIPISSIPRTDGGTLPLVLARLYANAQTTSTHQFSSLQEVRNFGDNYSGGDFYQYVMSGADGVSTPANWTQPATETLNMRIRGFVFYARGNVAANILFIGDSIDHGLGGGGDLVTNNAANTMQWSGLSCQAVSTKDDPIGYISAGWSGKTSANFFSRGKTLIPVFKPNICVFPAYTPNDTTGTKIGVQTALNRAIDFIEFCWANQITPVVRTPVPYQSSGSEMMRKEIVDKIKSMGVLVIDANTPLYDGTASSLGYWKSPTYTVDGTHPSYIGYNLIKQQAIELWKLLLL